MLDVDFAQLVHCVQAAAEPLVGVQVLHVVAAEHTDEDVVVLAAEHPDEIVIVDDAVGALAEQPRDTEVLALVAIGVAAAVAVVEFDGVCASTPPTLTIAIATAAATKKCAIFFMTNTSFLFEGRNSL